MKRRQPLWWAVICAVLIAGLALLPTANAAKRTNKTYTIAMTQDLSGPLAGLSGPIVAGATTAARYINDHGGLKGSGAKLKVTALDDKATPQQGIANAKQLLSQKPVGFIGHASSTISIPVMQLLDRAQIPAFDTTGIAQITTDRWNFHLQGSSGNEYVNSARYCASKGKGRRMAFMINRSPGQTLVRGEAKKVLERQGWSVLTDQDYLPSDTDLSAQAANIAKVKPDCIVAAVVANLVPTFMRGLKANGVTAPVLNFSPGSDIAGHRAANTSQYMAWQQLPSPIQPGKTAKLILAAAKRYGTSDKATGFYFTAGWVHVQTIAAGLAKANCFDKCDGPKLLRGMEAVGRVDIGDLGPPLTYSRTDHWGTTSAKLYRWDAKKQLPVAITKAMEFTRVPAFGD